MSASEFAEWQMIDECIEPFGEWRMDVRMGQAVSALLNALGAGPKSCLDYVLDFVGMRRQQKALEALDRAGKRSGMSVSEIKAFCKALAKTVVHGRRPQPTKPTKPANPAKPTKPTKPPLGRRSHG